MVIYVTCCIDMNYMTKETQMMTQVNENCEEVMTKFQDWGDPVDDANDQKRQEFQPR